jgi:hypothetical protein
MVRCNKCEEFIFSIEVLRHDTSDRPVVGNVTNIKYCPFCGRKVENKHEKKQK